MGKRLLLVEGRDDQFVVANLLSARGIAGLEIKAAGGRGPVGGVEQLLQDLPVYLKGSDVERLGVLVDADKHLDRRWDQLRYRLKEATGTELPARPNPQGTAVDLEGGRRFAVWIMPNNVLPGMLEDFIAGLVPAGDSILPLVDTFLDGIPLSEQRFSVRNRPKARIHAWLAVQREPGKPLGLAITMKYLDGTSSIADNFVNWLRSSLID